MIAIVDRNRPNYRIIQLDELIKIVQTHMETDRPAFLWACKQTQFFGHNLWPKRTVRAEKTALSTSQLNSITSLLHCIHYRTLLKSQALLHSCFLTENYSERTSLNCSLNFITSSDCSSRAIQTGDFNWSTCEQLRPATWSSNLKSVSFKRS